MQYAPVPTKRQLSKFANSIASDSEARHVRRIEGGLGCTTDVLELSEPVDIRRRLILRRHGDWRENRAEGVVERELTAIRIASAGDVPVPDLIWVDNEHIFDESAFVISYVDGEPLARYDRPGDWPEQTATAIAQVHTAPLSNRAKTHLNDIERLPDKWRSEREPSDKFTSHPQGVKIWERRQELLEITPKAETSFLHADFWTGNTLWKEGKLVSVIDWEDAGFGDPAVDISGCANDLRMSGFDEGADRFVDAYSKITGNDLESLALWTIAGLAGGLGEIERQLPSYHAAGWPELSAEDLVEIHDRLIERALTETR